MTNLGAFLRERNAALLSLDKEKILAYARKWGAKLPFDPNDEEMFWCAVHKAITAIPSLPSEARSASKRWLQSRGYSSWDDGDVKA